MSELHICSFHPLRKLGSYLLPTTIDIVLSMTILYRSLCSMQHHEVGIEAIDTCIYKLIVLCTCARRTMSVLSKHVVLMESTPNYYQIVSIWIFR